MKTKLEKITVIEKNPGRPINDSDKSSWIGRVAARIRELRLRKYSTQAEFCEALAEQELPVTQTTVAGWETGRRVPHVKDFPAIAAALGIKKRSLLPDE